MRYTVVMILLIHIIIALCSLLVSGLNLARPSWRALRFTYGLVAATLASGTYLTILHPAHLANVCLSGLAYLAIITTLAGLTRHKLARETLRP